MGTAPPSMNPDDLAAQQSLFESLKDLVSAIQMNSTVLKSMVDEIKEVNRGMKDTQTTVEDTADDFKNIVNFIDDIKESLKVVVVDAKKLRSNLDSKNVEQTVNQFEKLKGTYQALVKSGKLSAQQVKTFEHNIQQCDKSIQSLKTKFTDIKLPIKSNTKAAQELNSVLHEMVLNTERVANKMSGMKMGTITKGITGLNSLLNRSGHVERMVNVARRAHGIKTDREEKVKNNKSHFEGKRARAAQALIEKHPELFYKDENGVNQLDHKKFAKHHGRKEAISTMVGDEGGRLNRGLMGVGQRLAGHDNGVSRWVGGKMLQSAEAGGGNMIEGMLGGVEGAGAGAIAMAAIPMAVGALFKETFDAVATQNKSIEKNLGKGGIFTGDQGGGEAISNVKRNIRAWGLNRYGINTERQMAVAQTMQESGVSVASLANKGTGMSGSIGNIANIAFKQAREVGLTDVESVKQTLTMMQKYKMTMDGTQTFFQTLGKDIRASGLSTTKYLELIDDVTSQFNDMGKSIGSVTTILRSLGSTGTETYDQMKDNVTALMGQDKTIEQRAALFSSMGSKTSRSYNNEEEKLAQSAAQNFSQSLSEAIDDVMPDHKAEVLKGTGNLSTPEQMDRAMMQFRSMMTTLKVPATAATTQLESMQQAAIQARVRANAFKSGDAVGAASIMGDYTSTDANTKMTTQLQALIQGLNAGGTDLNKFLTNPNAVNSSNAATVTGVAKTYGFSDTTKMLPLRSAMQTISGSIIDELHDGLNSAVTANMRPEDIEKVYSDFLEKTGQSRDKRYKTAQEQFRGTDAASLKQGYLAHMSSGEFLSQIDSNSLVSRSMRTHNTESLVDQANKIAGISNNTQTTEDLLKGIKDALISKVGTPLIALVNLFTRWFGKSDPLSQKMQAATAENDRQDTQDDAELLDQLVQKLPNWKDPHSSMSGTSAADVQNARNALWQKIQEGKGTDEDYKKYDTYTSEMRQIVAHLKPGGQFSKGDLISQLGKEHYAINPANNTLMDVGSSNSNPVAGDAAKKVNADDSKKDTSSKPPVVQNITTHNTYSQQNIAPVKSTPSGEQQTTAVTGFSWNDAN